MRIITASGIAVLQTCIAGPSTQRVCYVSVVAALFTLLTLEVCVRCSGRLYAVLAVCVLANGCYTVSLAVVAGVLLLPCEGLVSCPLLITVGACVQTVSASFTQEAKTPNVCFHHA